MLAWVLPVVRTWLVDIPVHHLTLHRHPHVMDAVVLQLGDAVRILMADVATKEIVHGVAVKTLGLRDRAVLVSKQQGLEVDDLLTKLGDGSRESIVLCAEQLDLGLQVGKPLLLSLTALEGSDTIAVSIDENTILPRRTYRFLSRKFLRFSSSVILRPLLSNSSSFRLAVSSSESSSSSMGAGIPFLRPPLGASSALRLVPAACLPLAAPFLPRERVFLFCSL